MKFRVIALVAMFCFLSSSPFANAQGPGKQHEELKKLEGRWKAVMKMEGSEIDAKCDFKMTCGGMWLESNLEADLGGIAFHGKGLDSYDATKQEYVSVWVDSMNGAPMVMKGKKEGNVTTVTGVGPGPAGDATYTGVTTYESNDKMLFKMLMKQDGKDTEIMTVTYTRVGS